MPLYNRAAAATAAAAAAFGLALILAANAYFASADPLKAPNLRLCQKAVATSPNPTDNTTMLLDCCLPWYNRPLLDFSWDRYPVQQQKIRRPAHKADADYVAKLNRAYELMRALPDDDPRSFEVQANMHCAFCNGAYKQLDTNITLQVHFSWFFMPWHRLYLYFHERILASLLGDPSFALVYWNWDNQILSNDTDHIGNNMPRYFTIKDTPIFDAKRDRDHTPASELVRINVVSNVTTTDTPEEIAQENLNILYQSLVTANTADMFMGGAYRQGTDLSNSSVTDAPLGGSLELNVHSGIHYWTGDPNRKLRSNMGVFTTAARDPIFYAHHANVDRLWDVWTTLPGGCRKDPTDEDYLEAEFLFYDENQNLVKVKAKEAMDLSKMGVSYEAATEGDELWRNFEPKAAAGNEGNQVEYAKGKMGIKEISTAVDNNAKAIALGSNFTALVKLPAKISTTAGDQSSLSANDEQLDEVLVIQGVDLSRDDYVNLKVFVNMPTADSNTPIYTAEYVGSATIVPSPEAGKRLFTNVKMELGDNLKRLGLQDEDMVVITIVVDAISGSPVSIRGMKIQYQSTMCSTSSST